MRICLTLILAIMFVFAGQAQEAKVEARKFDFDVIPPDATIAIAIRDVSDLKRKMLELSKQTDGQFAMMLNYIVGFGPEIIRSYVGMKESYDESGTIALVGFGNDESFAAVAPYTNLDDVAKAYECDKKELAAGKLIKVNNPMLGQDLWIATREKHLIIGLQAAVARSAKRGLSKKIDPKTSVTFSDDDVIITVNIAQLQRMAKDGELDKSVAITLIEAFLPGVSNSLDVSSELQRATLGFSVDHGINTTLVADFEGEESKRLLTKLQNEAHRSNLNGLPVGQLVLAGSRSSGPDTGDLFRAILETESGIAPILTGIVAPWHIEGLMGVIDQGFSRADIARAAIYRNEQEQENGVFCFIAVMDTDNGADFIDEIRKLIPVVNTSVNPDEQLDDQIDEKAIAKMVSFLSHENRRAREFMVTKLRLLGRHALAPLREAAKSDLPLLRSRSLQLIKEIESDLSKERADFLTGKLTNQLKPKFGYMTDFEKRENTTVDAVRLDIEPKDKTIQPKLKYMLGPEWDKIRLAKVKDQVVVMLGSNTKLFDQTLSNLKNQAPGIEAKKHYADFRKQSPGELITEFHLSMADAIVMSGAVAAEDAPVSKAHTSIGLSVSPQKVQLDIVFPIEEINILKKIWER